MNILKKGFCLAAGILAAGGVLAGNEEAVSAEDEYRLVWSDEFNGESLNRNTWNIEINGNGNGNAELQYYTDRPENVSVGTDPASGKGCLILTARKEDYEWAKFTSGRITTKNKVYFTHGKIEASIKIPRTANGLWPAFWMMGNSYDQVGWPRCSETDILEMGNAEGIKKGTQNRYFNGACHWGFYQNGGYPNYAKASTNSYDIQDGEFHLFTCYWDTENIRMYLDQDKYPDAAPYYEMGISGMDDDWATGRYFHQPNFILFNLAVGGHFTGILNPDNITALPEGEASMYVDYVKVYQRGTPDETFHEAGTSKIITLNAASTVTICPNPANDRIIFNRTVQRVEVVNLNGDVITVASDINDMDVSSWGHGTYLLRVKVDGNEETVKLLVK